jgi:hypothetical protein
MTVACAREHGRWTRGEIGGTGAAWSGGAEDTAASGGGAGVLMIGGDGGAALVPTTGDAGGEA